MFNTRVFSTKEEELARLNREIDVETRKLLLKLEERQEKKAEDEKTEGVFKKDVASVKKSENDVKIIPESVDHMGQENIIRFLKAKVLNHCENIKNKNMVDLVKVLTEQVEVWEGAQKKRAGKMKDLQVKLDEALAEKEKWFQKAETSRNLLSKNEKQMSCLAKKADDARVEVGQLKKELESVKKELRDKNGCEKRLNRSLEEVEKLKADLKKSKQEGKGWEETSRRREAEINENVKRLERQKAELLSVLKKEMAVVCNLKKQRGLFDLAKILQTIEDDFTLFLQS